MLNASHSGNHNHYQISQSSVYHNQIIAITIITIIVRFTLIGHSALRDHVSDIMLQSAQC